MLYRRTTPRTRKRITAPVAAILSVIIAVTVAATCVACNTRDHVLTGTAFGSYYSIEYTGEDRDEQLKTLISELNDDFDVTGSGDIAAINATSANTPVPVSDLTFKALSLAFGIAADSDSAFDPTVYPLTELWGFAPEDYTGTATSVPSDEQISLTLESVGTDLFVLNEADKTVTKLKDGAELDVGGIGKGFAADTVKEVLGDDATAIDFGATLYLTDEAKVYIQNPKSNDFVASATISDLSVATSGDYQRYYFFDGVRYHHVIGRDGYPAGIFDGDPVVSATITSPSAAVSDALSTAAMVLGNTDTLKALLDKYDAAAVLITESGRYVVGDSPFVFE